MTKHYTVHLPVKPYIKKFVETIEGPQLRYTGTSPLCRIVCAYLENKSSTGLSAAQKADALSKRTTSIQITVPMRCMYTIGASLSPDGILQANAYLQDEFERAVSHFLRQYTKSKEGRYKGYKDAIQAFADFYNIVLEDDITYEGLKKLEYRFRKKEETFFSKIVLSRLAA